MLSEMLIGVMKFRACLFKQKFKVVGRGGALDKSMTLKRRVVGSTPALAAT